MKSSTQFITGFAGVTTVPPCYWGINTIKVRIMKSRLIALFVFMGITVAAYADDILPRRSFLGLAPVSGAVGDKVEVRQITPSGTAADLGIKPGDILQTVNGRQVDDFPALLRILSSIGAGDEMSVTVTREGVAHTLEAQAKGRPQETGHGYAVQYSQFQWQDNDIRTIIFRPDTPRPDGAAVLYIQGYTCGSIDYGAVPDVTLNQVLATYARAGFVVFKMEKPGVGDSRGPLTCADYDFTTENRAFRAGLQALKATSRVNPDRIFTFGHSLGVLHSAVLAEKGQVKGVMGYGGVIKPWHDYFHDIFAVQAVKYWGTSREQAQQNLQSVEPFLHAWLKTDTPWSEILAAPYTKQVQRAELLPLSGDQIFNRHFSFFRDVNRYDFAALWEKAAVHVLMMHGEYDIQAIESGWQTQIAALVNNNHPGKATAMEFKGTDHALMHYPSAQALLAAMADGTYQPARPGERYNKEIAARSLEWMEHILSEE